MVKRKIVAFDFDGTITNKDTLLRFILFVKGPISFYSGFIRYAIFLVAFKLKLYPNWKLKQKIFSHFFKGMKYSDFCRFGNIFADEIEKMVRPKALEAIQNALKNGESVYVLTASIEDWVKPWCERQGISNVLATKVVVDHNGLLTGHFSTPNCFGQEKVARLLEMEPDRSSYILYAFGDSRGDKELIEYSDEGWYNKFK